MAVVQLRPNLAEGALAQGYRVPRGTALRSLLGRGEQTACEYRTAHDVTLWPLELTHAEYTGYVGDLGDVQLPARRARRASGFKLRTTAGLNFADLALDDLTLFVRGGDELPMRLYEQLIGAHRGASWCARRRGPRPGSTRSPRSDRAASASTTTRRCCRTARARSRAIACCTSTSRFPPGSCS